MKKPPKCDICGKVFSRRDNMERHKSRHLHREMYPCDLCGRAFSQKSYLKLHKRIHSGERPFGCNICGHAFSRNDHLVIHIRGHQGLKLFKCEVCSKAFSRRSYLTVHQRIHSGKRPYRCHVCGCAFYRGDHLVRHRRKQHGEEPVATTVYVTTASDGSQTVYAHANPHLTGELQPQQVNIQVLDGQELKCNNIIINSIGGTENMVGVTGGENNENNTYSDCNAACTGAECCIEAAQQQEQQQQQQQQLIDCGGNLAKLVVGEPVDPSTLQFQNCTDADQQKPTFVTQTHDIVGMLGANNKLTNIAGKAITMAFKCEFCSKCFSRRDNLERHKSTHQDVKQFKCEVCSKSFSRKSYLTVHSRIHTGERPYKCEVCGYTFSRKDHLVKHQRNKDGERKLSCIPQQQQQQQQQLQLGIESKDIGVNQPTIMTVSHHQLAAAVANTAENNTTTTVVVPASHAHSGLLNPKAQIYHTAIAKMGPTSGTAMPVFPTTIEISPATTQIFPTIQMYAAAHLNVPQTLRNHRDSTW